MRSQNPGVTLSFTLEFNTMEVFFTFTFYLNSDSFFGMCLRYWEMILFLGNIDGHCYQFVDFVKHLRMLRLFRWKPILT